MTKTIYTCGIELCMDTDLGRTSALTYPIDAKPVGIAESYPFTGSICCQLKINTASGAGEYFLNEIYAIGASFKYLSRFPGLVKIKTTNIQKFRRIPLLLKCFQFCKC